MNYLEVLNVPILRSTDELASSVLAQIMNHLDERETLELIYMKKNQKIHCFIGTESKHTESQVNLFLTYQGYICQPVRMNFNKTTSILLRRKLENRTVIVKNSPPQQFVLPQPIQSAFRNEAFFYYLNSIDEEAGISFFLRKSKGLPPNSISQFSTYLHDKENNCISNLINQVNCVELVGCVFSSKENQKLLASYACHTFGLTDDMILNSKVDASLFQLFSTLKINPIYKPFCYTFTYEEIAYLTDLTISAGTYGLDLNKDTICHIPIKNKLLNNDKNHLFLGENTAHETISIPISSLTKSLFIGGSPGSGKSNLLWYITYQLYTKGINCLIIESAKEEMHHLRKVIPNLNTFRPKENEMVLNPFAIPLSVTVAEYKATLIQILKESFQMEGPLESLFLDTLENCFSRNGFNDNSTITSENVAPFGLNEFIEEYNILLNNVQYSSKTKSDISTAGSIRLKKLLSSNHAVFDSIHSIPVSQLMSGMNLLQLSCLTTIESKQLFGTILLLYLSTWMRLKMKHSDNKCSFVILMDEAHNLLSSCKNSSGEDYSFSKDFANMILELRSVGVSFVICDQSSENIPASIFDVCDTKIFVGSSTYSGILNHNQLLGMDDIGYDHLYLLGPGDGIVKKSSDQQAQFFHAENIIDRFNIKQDYSCENEFLKKNPYFTLKTFRECSLCPNNTQCSSHIKNKSYSFSKQLLLDFEHPFKSIQQIPTKTKEDEINKKKIFNQLILQLMNTLKNEKSIPVQYCTLIQFVRAYNRESKYKLNLSTLLKQMKV